MAARDVVFGSLQAPTGGWLAPLTAHPAMLGTSENTRFNVSPASAHVLGMAQTLSDCIATISREEMRLTTGAALPKFQAAWNLGQRQNNMHQPTGAYGLTLWVARCGSWASGFCPTYVYGGKISLEQVTVQWVQSLRLRLFRRLT